MKRSLVFGFTLVLAHWLASGALASITAQIQTGSGVAVSTAAGNVNAIAGVGYTMFGGYASGGTFNLDTMTSGIIAPKPGQTLAVTASNVLAWPGDLGTSWSCSIDAGGSAQITISKSGTWPDASSAIETYSACFDTATSCDPTNPMSSNYVNSGFGSGFTINPSSGNDSNLVNYLGTIQYSPDNGSDFVFSYEAVQSKTVYCAAGGPCVCP